MRILSTLRGLLRQTPVTNGRLEGDMDANGQRIVNVGEPTLDDDAATKKYVDDHGGGGGGTRDYNDLENKPILNGKTLQGNVNLTGVDIETEPNSGRLVTEAIDGLGNDLSTHEERDDNPHSVTAEQVGAYTTDQVDGMLANKANSSDVYDKEEIALKLSFKQDALTDAQKEVLDGGPYLPATENNEGGFDVDAPIRISGGVQAFAASFVNGILKGGKEVATEEQVDAVSDKVDDIKSTVSTDNRFLVGGSYSEAPAEGSPTTAAIQTRTDETAEWTDEIRIDKGYDAVKLADDAPETVSLDKSVQTVHTRAANLVINIPKSVEGTVRDFCIYIFNQNSSGGTATAIAASSDIDVFQDENDSAKWNAACPAGGQIAIYLTAIPESSGMVFRAARSVLKRAEDIT